MLDRCAKPLIEADGPFSAGTSFNEPTLPPSKLDKVISRSLVERFLSDYFLSLLRAGLVVLGDNNGDEGGWDSCANFRSKFVLEHDQSSLAVIPTKVVCVVPGVSVLVEEELDISDMGLGGEDSLSIPLMSITPFGLPLSAKLNCGYQAVECVNMIKFLELEVVKGNVKVERVSTKKLDDVLFQQKPFPDKIGLG